MQINSGIPYWVGGIVEGLSPAQGPYCAPIIGGGQQCFSATGYYSANYSDALAFDPVLDSASANYAPFQIDQDQTSTLMVGTWTDKFGRTTGWTTGKIKTADYDTPRSDDGAWVLHSVRVGAGVWAGDSGSPVFTPEGRIAQGNYGSMFDGIVWGGDSLITVGGHSVYGNFIYSPLTQIRAALSNSITTH